MTKRKCGVTKTKPEKLVHRHERLLTKLINKLDRVSTLHRADRLRSVSVLDRKKGKCSFTTFGQTASLSAALISMIAGKIMEWKPRLPGFGKERSSNFPSKTTRQASMHITASMTVGALQESLRQSQGCVPSGHFARGHHHGFDESQENLTGS